MPTIFRWTVAGTDASGQQEWNSTMHYLADASDPQDVHDALLTYYSTGGTGSGMERWLATVDSTVKLTRTSVYEEVDPTSTDLPTSFSADHSFSGSVTNIDPATPFALCPFVKFKTAFASRSSRGGTHLSPSLDQNHLTASGLFDTTLSWWAAVVALSGYMLGHVTVGAGSVPIIYSRTRRIAGDEDFFFELTSAVPQTTPRWLRRRDVGR
jgi:hypothetical protein